MSNKQPTCLSCSHRKTDKCMMFDTYITNPYNNYCSNHIISDEEFDYSVDIQVDPRISSDQLLSKLNKFFNH